MMNIEAREGLRDDDRPELGAVSADGPGLAQAFFLPGVGGSEFDFDFETLDSHVGTHLRLRLAAYPGMGARGAVLSSMRATAAAVAADIQERQPEGSVALIGYSFGGSLSLEVSRQLSLSGRCVGFLGILDAPFGIEELQGLFAVLRLATVPRRAAKALVEATARTEVSLRLMNAATAPTAGNQGRGEAVRRALLTHLRTKALAGWRPEACHAPGVLICTGVLGQENRDRWQALCPNLVHVRVDAQHESLLGRDSVEEVAAALLQASRSRGLVPT